MRTSGHVCPCPEMYGVRDIFPFFVPDSTEIKEEVSSFRDQRCEGFQSLIAYHAPE